MGFVADDTPASGRFVPDDPIKPINTIDDSVTGPPIEGVINQGGDTSTAGKMIVEGAVSAPFYAIPYAGPIAGGAAGALAGQAYDRILGKPFDVSKAAKDTAVSAALGYGLKGAYQGYRALVPKPLEYKIASTIREGIKKGIRPSVSGKSNFPQTEKYYDKAQSAVETIIENKGILKFPDGVGGIAEGQLPKNLNEFSQAIDQTKRHIFGKYDEMLKGSELLGRNVDVKPIVSELNTFMGDRANRIAGGSGFRRANEIIGELNGPLTLSEAQDVLAVLNGRTKAFLSNPSPDQVSSYAVDNLTANKLRQALDSAVEGVGYTPLRKQYGALREIEKEVSNMALAYARKNTKGLIDFADIASAAEAARAIASMNPGSAAAAVTIRGLKEYYKYIINPNRVIRNMFADADKLIGKRVPIPAMKALPPGPRSMPSGVPDDSYVRGVPADLPEYGYVRGVPVRALPKGTPPLALPPASRPMPGRADESYVRGVPAELPPFDPLQYNVNMADYYRGWKDYWNDVIPQSQERSSLGIPYEELGLRGLEGVRNTFGKVMK